MNADIGIILGHSGSRTPLFGGINFAFKRLNAEMQSTNCNVIYRNVKCPITHIHTHIQPFYSSLDFVWNNPGEPVPEETFTHSHPSWSSNIPICFLHLLRSMASSLFNPCALQSFPQSLSKFSLVYLLAWRPPLHTTYISSPNHYLLFAAHAHIIATCFAAQ